MSYLLLHDKVPPTCSTLQQPFFSYKVSQRQESRNNPSIPPPPEAISKTPIHRRGVWPPAHHHPCARCLRVWFQACVSTWACVSRCPHKLVCLPVMPPDQRDPSSLYPSNVCQSFFPLLFPLYLPSLFLLFIFNIFKIFLFIYLCGCAGSLLLGTGILQWHRQTGFSLP